MTVDVGGGWVTESPEDENNRVGGLRRTRETKTVVDVGGGWVTESPEYKNNRVGGLRRTRETEIKA